MATDGAMGDASIRAVIDTPIHDAIAVTEVTGAIAVIAARDVTVGSAWKDAAAAVVTVTVVASEAVIKIDASVLRSVATMKAVRKAKAIGTRVGAAKAVAAKAVAVKAVAATETAIAAIPTGPMEIAWRQALARVATSTAMTTSETASRRL